MIRGAPVPAAAGAGAATRRFHPYPRRAPPAPAGRA
jgi:hypothetical protein